MKLHRVFALLSITTLAGCAAPVDEDMEGDSPELKLPDADRDIEIFRGDSGLANLAVIELQRSRPGQSNAFCTGFFITRRHIVTSAHCTDRNNPNQWYKVRAKTGAGAFRDLKDPARADTWVLLQEATFPGFNFDAPVEARDIAILTLSAPVESSVPANQQRLVLGRTRPANGSTFSLWGWGITDVGGTPPRDLLFGDGAQEATVSSVGTDGSYNWLNATVNNGARTCEGDSGGPSSAYVGGRYIATGVHATVRKPDGTFRPGCAQNGDNMRWTTTYDKLTWIEQTVRGVYGAAFSCKRLGAGAGAYMQCY